MWETIKKWFGLADRITAEDIELARAVAEKNIKEVNDRINQVKEEVSDVVESAKKVIDQAEDIVADVKAKARKSRKKKV
jgi:ElaB/YqjD/DUF883 family membrane-anchored ribosome-binding protein